MITPEAQRAGAATNRVNAEARSRQLLADVAAGKSHRDIAIELGVNVSSVRTIVLRARRRLGVEARTSPAQLEAQRQRLSSSAAGAHQGPKSAPRTRQRRAAIADSDDRLF